MLFSTTKNFGVVFMGKEAPDQQRQQHASTTKSETNTSLDNPPAAKFKFLNSNQPHREPLGTPKSSFRHSQGDRLPPIQTTLLLTFFHTTEQETTIAQA